MGTKARISTALLATLMVAGAALAGERPAAAGGSAPQKARRAAAIAGGHDTRRTWLVAEYRQLHVRKQADKASKAISVELRFENDAVQLNVSPGVIAVARNGHQVVLDSAEALVSLQHLLGGSQVAFAAKAMLSELEATSDLKAPDMALLSTAAFLAALTGDVEAPRRLSDRFVAKHRGIYQPVRWNGGCWAEYVGESTAAWDQLQGCMSDADDKGFFRAAFERIACNSIWLLRSESAWAEFLNCVSPLAAIAQ